MLTSHYKDKDGWHTVYSPQTFEATCAVLETVIRNWIHDLQYIRVYVPVLQTTAPFQVPMLPFMFAIAFDQLTSNTATPTSFSVTCTGSNVCLAALGVNDPAPSAASYNSVSLTSQGSVTVPVANDKIALFTLLGASTGAHTLSYTGSGGTQAVSYSGVGALSGFATNTGGSGGDINITFTVSVASSVVLSSAYGRTGPHALSASTGIANDRYGLSTNGLSSVGDSGSVSSNTLCQWHNSNGSFPNDNGMLGIVLEPAAAPATGGFFLAAAR